MKNKSLIYNILIGLLLLSIPILSSPDVNKGLFLFTFPPFLQNFLSYAILVCFFFCHYYIIIPKFYNKKNALIYILLFIGFLCLMMLLPQNIINAPPPKFSPGENMIQGKRNPIFELLNFNDGLVFQFIIVWLLTLSLKTENKLKEVKNQQLKTENSFLKSQINSHFLFNALNNIYSLSLNQSHKTPDAILKLSQMMRYVVAESNIYKVSLEQELEYIDNYIELQKLRINKLVELNIDIRCNTFNKKIAPIILINFIENAFKYGINTEEKSIINIEISTHESVLKLYVKNNIHSQNKEFIKSETGLKNTKQRLESIYQKKHKLTINKTKKTFEVQLLIDLKND